VKGTIKSSEEISTLFRTAKRTSSPNLLILRASSLKERDQQGRVAFIAGKRLGNAPWRNRAKRVMREAARRAGIPQEGFDIALVAREGTAEKHPDELAQEISRILGKRH
jgi:ribonuclease P protein component